MKQVAGYMSEITHASVEQSAGIEQVNQAITEMDEIIQRNAALVEEAAESMQDPAIKLGQLVDSFRLVSSGKSPAPVNGTGRLAINA